MPANHPAPLTEISSWFAEWPNQRGTAGLSFLRGEGQPKLDIVARVFGAGGHFRARLGNGQLVIARTKAGA